MAQQIIHLGENAELIFDEPSVVSAIERPLILAQTIVQEISSVGTIYPSSRSGSTPIAIGCAVYRIYYELRIRRVMSALTAYSEAINHIENSKHLYDTRLARKAIETLRECYAFKLR